MKQYKKNESDLPEDIKEIHDENCAICQMQKFQTKQTLYVTPEILDGWKKKHKGHYVLPYIYTK